jgi:hypothetical protein
MLLIAAAPPSTGTFGKGCLNKGIDLAAGLPDPGGFRRLDQLPPANEILTVIHSENGCMKPVIVRYRIGGNPSVEK